MVLLVTCVNISYAIYRSADMTASLQIRFSNRIIGFGPVKLRKVCLIGCNLLDMVNWDGAMR